MMGTPSVGHDVDHSRPRSRRRCHMHPSARPEAPKPSHRRPLSRCSGRDAGRTSSQPPRPSGPRSDDSSPSTATWTFPSPRPPPPRWLRRRARHPDHIHGSSRRASRRRVETRIESRDGLGRALGPDPFARRATSLADGERFDVAAWVLSRTWRLRAHEGRLVGRARPDPGYGACLAVWERASSACPCTPHIGGRSLSSHVRLLIN